MRRALALAVLLLAGLAQGQQQRAAEIVDAWAKDQRVVGCTVTVRHNGESWTHTYGNGKADTQYRLASISKPITAIGFMRLVEQDRIGLDAPISETLKSWPSRHPAITPRQILTHTSGIRHYIPDKTDNNVRNFKTAKDALSLFKYDALLFPPGTRVSYSTHAFTALAALMEEKSGMPFQDYMRRRIFMGSIDVEDLTETPRPATWSRLYAQNGGVYSRREDNSWKYAGGGMVSNAPDLTLFAERFAEGKIISPASVRRMLEQQDAPAQGRGLAWGLAGSLFMHSGSQQGSSTFLLGDTASGTYVAILANTNGAGGTAQLARTLRDLFVDP